MHLSQPSLPRRRLSRPAAHGYRPGVSQPAGTLTFSWLCPPELLREPAQALQRLDAWLSGPLAISLLPEPSWQATKPQGSPEPVWRAAWRIQQLASELLRLINLPVFDPGRLEEIRSEPGASDHWRIRARVPMLELHPAQAFLETYNRSTGLVSDLLVTELDDIEIARIHNCIEAEYIARFAPLIAAAKSTIPLLLAAHQRAIPFRHLGNGIYQLGWGCRSRRYQGGANDLDSAIGGRVCQDKRLTVQLLRSAGLPVPLQRQTATPEQALEAAMQLGWPVVAKPANRDRGEGVTLYIRSPEELRDAWRKARKLSSIVLVEKQVDGVCHRLHVVAGQVISISRRLPKAVCGDGRQTVRNLIASANMEQLSLPPWQRLKPFPSDALAITCLKRDGLTLDSVPAEGQWACLAPFNGSEWGGVVENCTETAHPDNVAAAVLAARVCHLTNAGVDLISVDISQPWSGNGAVINEVNYAPESGGGVGFEFKLDRIHEHYFPDAGRIPLHVYLGGHRALQIALQFQKQLGAQGVACSLVAFDRSLDPSGQPQNTTAQGLFARCLALLLDPATEALAIAVQTGEWLETGLPFDRPAQWVDCGDPLLDCGPLPQAVVRARLRALLENQS
jgi:cyanophycin synthetase